MASTKQTGRPKIPWNASRSRKLVRLYLMTDLSLPRIQEVLKARDFTPGRRNIQMQLKALLPEYSKIWRQHRPYRDQMRNRLTELKRSREKRGLKHQQHQSGREGKANIYSETECVILRQSHAGDEDHVWPAKERSASGTPSRYVSPSNKRTVTKESPSSTKFNSPQFREQQSTRAANHAQTSKAFKLSLSPPARCRNMRLQEQADSGTNSSEPLPMPRNGLKANSSIKVLHSEGTVIRIGSSRSIQSSDRESVVSSSTRSFCSISHLNSVLSPSLSLRSSLGYTISLSSKHQSSGSNISWTSDELNSWNQLVDESAFPRTRPKDEPEKSLRDRPCCNFFQISRPTWRAGLFCDICGFSEMHWRARFSKAADAAWMDPTSLDHFQNTPLHHAAAAGNTAQVLNLMSSRVRPSPSNSQRNTSGETFLHVFRLKSQEQFSAYEEVLEKAENEGFPFDAIDHQGQRISQVLEDLLDNWPTKSIHLAKVARILDIKDIPHCQDGKLIPRGSDKSWYEFEDGRRARETKLISTLKNWETEKDSGICLKSLVRDSDIHVRDRRGYTALALAAGNGVHEAVTLLLEAGANPNTRSHHRTSVMQYAGRNLRRAQSTGQNSLYALILSCMALLSDHGGKANVSVYDEYGIIGESSRHRPISSRSKQTSASSITRKSAIRGRRRRQLESIAEPSHQPKEPTHKIRPRSLSRGKETAYETAPWTGTKSVEQSRRKMLHMFEPPEPAVIPTVPDRSEVDAIFQDCFSYLNYVSHDHTYEEGNEQQSAPLLLPSSPPAIENLARPLENYAQDHGYSGQLDAKETDAQEVTSLQEEGQDIGLQQIAHIHSGQESNERYLGTGDQLQFPELGLTGIECFPIHEPYTSRNLDSYQSCMLAGNTTVSSTSSVNCTPNLNTTAEAPGWLLPEQTIKPPPLPPRKIKPALPSQENGLLETRFHQYKTQNHEFGDVLYSPIENRGTTTGVTPQIRDFTFAPYDPPKAIPLEGIVDESQDMTFDQAYQWYETADITTLASINGNEEIVRGQQSNPLKSLSEQLSMESLATPRGLEPNSIPDTNALVVDSYDVEAFNPAKRRRTAPKSDMLEVLLEQGWSGWR